MFGFFLFSFSQIFVILGVSMIPLSFLSSIVFLLRVFSCHIWKLFCTSDSYYLSIPFLYLNREEKGCSRTESTHLSGILCCVVYFSCFLVTQNNLQTYSVLCWTLNWYSTPIKLSTVAGTCYCVMVVTLQHTILCIYYGVLHFRCIISPLAQSNLAYHFIILSLIITRFSC